MRLKAASVILASLLAVPVSAYGAEIAVFTKNKVDPFYEEVRVGADKAAETLGYETVQYAPTRPNNFQDQIAQVEDAITRKPVGMAFVPVDAKGLRPSVDKVRAAGIPIVNYIETGDGDFNSYVIYNDHKIGSDVARVLADKLGGKGNIVIIEGIKGSAASDNRTAGALEVLKSYPDIKVLAVQAANFQRLQGLQVMENLMQQFPTIDGVVAASDNMGLGAIEAMESAGGPVAQLVSVDGTVDGVKAVADGRMLATAEFSGFQLGCTAVQFIDRLTKGEAVPDRLELTADIITQDKAAEYGLPLDKRTCKPLESLGL